MRRIADDLRKRLAESAKNRCGYCLMPQEIVPMLLEIEHLLPQALGGDDDEANLWLACRACNSYKHAKTHGDDQRTARTVKLFNPRTQNWREHFKFSADKSIIIGRTACGRATVAALKMNTEQSVSARKVWAAAGWYPPED